MEIAITADGDEAVREWNRAELNRAPDAYAPDLAPIGAQRADGPVSSTQENPPIRQRQWGCDRPRQRDYLASHRIGARVYSVHSSHTARKEERVIQHRGRAQDRSVNSHRPVPTQGGWVD
jgi:hypothetical protein